MAYYNPLIGNVSSGHLKPHRSQHPRHLFGSNNDPYCNCHTSVASTRVQGWGDEALKRFGCWEGMFPSPPRKGLEMSQCPSKENFLFCDLEMAYFGEFWGDKFKVCNNIGGYSHWRNPPTKIMGMSPASTVGLIPVSHVISSHIQQRFYITCPNQEISVWWWWKNLTTKHIMIFSNDIQLNVSDL